MRSHLTWRYEDRTARSLFWDFLGIAAAAGTLLGTDTTTGGYFTGLLAVGAALLAGMIISSKLESSSPLPILALLSMGFGFVSLVGWWPIWALFAAIIFMVLGGLHLLSSSRVE